VLGLLQQAQPLLPKTLERVRRGAGLVRAASEQRCTRVADDPCGLERLLSRFDRAGASDHREAVAPDLAPGDVEHASLAVLDLRRGELVRLHDRDHPVNARSALELEPRDVLTV